MRDGGCVGRVGEVEEHEAGGGRGYEGGDVGRGELVDAFEIPDTIISIITIVMRLYCEEGKGYIWLLVHCSSSTKSRLA